MMDPRQELEELRRLEELERKAGGATLPKARAANDTKALASGYYNSGSPKTLSDLIVPDRVKTDVAELPWYVRAAGGAKARWDQAALGLKDVFTDLTPEDRKLLEQGKAFQKEGGTAATLGGVGFDVGATLAPGLGISKLTAAKPVLTRALSQLGFGAGYGALTSPEEQGQGAIEGAVGTAVGGAAARLAGGLIKPFVTNDARALMNQGVQPTIGQAVGGGVNQLEQKLKSVLGVGDVIRNARGRAVDEFNEKAIQTAAPGVKGIGDDALTAARQSIGNRYNSVLDSVPQISVDKNAVWTTAQNIVNDPKLMLSSADKKKVLDLVRGEIVNRTGSIDGQMAKSIESALKEAATNADTQGVRNALRDFTGFWRNSLHQSVDAVAPGSAQALREADASWRAFIPLDRAGAYRGNQNIAANEVPGRFTPNSLRRSIEASDQSQFNNATRSMRGGNTPFDRLNTLTRQGENVLGDSVPDSGTAGRAIATGMLGLGGAAAGVDPATGLGAAALTLPLYSRGGSKFLMQGLEPAYKSAIQALSLRGVPTQLIDETLRKYGPEGVIAMARGTALQE